MRKYLPAILFLTTVFAFLAFNIAREVIAGISKKADIEKTEYKKKEEWFVKFTDKNSEKKEIVLTKISSPLILVNFWASWCGPCLKEFPGLVELRKKYPEEKLYILGINCDGTDPQKNLDEMNNRFKINFPNVLDPENKHLDAIAEQKLPTTLLFSKGSLIFSSFQQTDFLDASFLKIIDSELKKTK